MLSYYLGRQENPGAYWPASLPEFVSARFSEGSCLKKVDSGLTRVCTHRNSYLYIEHIHTKYRNRDCLNKVTKLTVGLFEFLGDRSCTDT